MAYDFNENDIDGFRESLAEEVRQLCLLEERVTAFELWNISRSEMTLSEFLLYLREYAVNGTVTVSANDSSVGKSKAVRELISNRLLGDRPGVELLSQAVKRELDLQAHQDEQVEPLRIDRFGSTRRSVQNAPQTLTAGDELASRDVQVIESAENVESPQSP